MPRDQERGIEADERERKQGMPGSGSDRAWWRPPSWSRSPLLHEWIRSGAVLIAAVWGVYTFIYKDIVSVQGAGRLISNSSPAEPLTAA
jgi:hypothetical protein